MTRRYTIAQVCEAIATSKGMLTKAADQLGCDVHTVYRYRDSSPIVQRTIRTARERMGDKAENALESAIDRGEGWAIAFYLRTQAKDRGYVERKEITTPDNQPFEVKLTDARERLAGRLASIAAREEAALDDGGLDGEGSGEPSP